MPINAKVTIKYLHVSAGVSIFEFGILIEISNLTACDTIECDGGVDIITLTLIKNDPDNPFKNACAEDYRELVITGDNYADVYKQICNLKKRFVNWANAKYNLKLSVIEKEEKASVFNSVYIETYNTLRGMEAKWLGTRLALRDVHGESNVELIEREAPVKRLHMIENATYGLKAAEKTNTVEEKGAELAKVEKYCKLLGVFFKASVPDSKQQLDLSLAKKPLK